MFAYNDCHTHASYGQKNGILIALDGKRGSKGGYSNKEVISKAYIFNMIPAQYVSWDFPDDLSTDIIKYHPRREMYSPREICEDIKRRKAKIIIIDTLNEPDWTAEDYWRIAKNYPEKKFLFSHAGGPDIQRFLTMTMFQKNIWIDFSYIQHVYGWCGSDNVMNPYIAQQIDYALRDPRLYKRILYGTDNMIDECDHSVDSIRQYMKYDSFEDVCINNFMSFVGDIM